MTEDGRTHYDGCYREHLDCAVARIEELEASLVTVAPLVHGGLPCIAGTRVPTRSIFEVFVGGVSIEGLTTFFARSLSEKQVAAALRWEISEPGRIVRLAFGAAEGTDDAA